MGANAAPASAPESTSCVVAVAVTRPATASAVITAMNPIGHRCP